MLASQSGRFRGERDRVRNDPWRGFLPRLKFLINVSDAGRVIYCFKWPRNATYPVNQQSFGGEKIPGAPIK